MELTFFWDSEKARLNVWKHGVTFWEAVSAFGDPLSVTVEDPGHSVGENRYILIGTSFRDRLVVVAHTDVDGTIRIISARQAGGRERRDYEEGKEPGR